MESTPLEMSLQTGIGVLYLGASTLSLVDDLSQGLTIIEGTLTVIIQSYNSFSLTAEFIP